MKLIKLLITFLLLLIYSNSNAYYYDDYKNYDKVIKVNTFALKLSYYEKGKKIGTFDISSWDEKNPTPLGKFKISTKSELMLSKSAWKLMPYRMEFLNWVYWIHALPEDFKWNLDTKSIIWAEAAWWCVRLDKKNAKNLYNWAIKWTYVLIAYDKKEYASKDDINVIKKYFEYINSWKYKEAYNLRTNKNYTFEEFKKIYKWLKIVVKDIKNNNWDFFIKTEIYNKDVLIKKSNSIFQISNWKIIKSYLIKK